MDDESSAEMPSSSCWLPPPATANPARDGCRGTEAPNAWPAGAEAAGVRDRRRAGGSCGGRLEERQRTAGRNRGSPPCRSRVEATMVLHG